MRGRGTNVEAFELSGKVDSEREDAHTFDEAPSELVPVKALEEGHGGGGPATPTGTATPTARGRGKHLTETRK